jgi:hypothetical protein
MSDDEDHELVRTRAGHLAVRSRRAGEVMHPGVGPRVEAERLYVGQSRLSARLLRDGGVGTAAAQAGPARAAQAGSPRAAAVERPGGDAVTVFDVGLGAASWHLTAQRGRSAIG